MTVNRGEDDLDGEPLPTGQVRRKGGGRKQVAVKDPGLVPALKRLVEPVTRGDPVRPLTWVSKSMDKLAAALTALGHPIRADTVRYALTKLGFSRQHNRKLTMARDTPTAMRSLNTSMLKSKLLRPRANP